MTEEKDTPITHADLMEKTKDEQLVFARSQGLEVKGYATKSKKDIAWEILKHMGLYEPPTESNAAPEAGEYIPPAPQEMGDGPAVFGDDLDYITDPRLMVHLGQQEGIDFQDGASLADMKAEIRAERIARDAATPEQVDEQIPEPNYQADQGRKPPMLDKNGRIGPPQLMKIPNGPVMELGRPSAPTDREVEFFIVNGLNHVVKRGVPTHIPPYLKKFIEDNNEQQRWSENIDTITHEEPEYFQRHGISFWDSPETLPADRKRMLVPVKRTTGNAMRA